MNKIQTFIIYYEVFVHLHMVKDIFKYYINSNHVKFVPHLEYIKVNLDN